MADCAWELCNTCKGNKFLVVRGKKRRCQRCAGKGVFPLTGATIVVGPCKKCCGTGVAVVVTGIGSKVSSRNGVEKCRTCRGSGYKKVKVPIIGINSR